MEKTWRWFGKKDKITLAQLKQIGVEGIVTALHDVPLGEVWTREKIHELKEYIESYGMKWSVVESLPVVETLKYGGPDRDHQIEVYKESLRNLGEEGIKCICYNFMPVLDWARTDLSHDNPNGANNLYMNWGEFAYFDIYILQREGAREDWAEFSKEHKWGRDLVAEADEIKKTSTPEQDHALVEKREIIVRTISLIDNFVVEAFSNNNTTIVLAGVKCIVENSSRERTEDVTCTKVNPSRFIMCLLSYSSNIILRELITFGFPFCSLKVVRKNVIQFHN
jgi:hypothetical protein